MYSHCSLTKSQARLCPALLAATAVMTAAASCLRIRLEFKVKDRYLRKQEVTSCRTQDQRFKQCVCAADLLSSRVLLVQASADISVLASLATEAFLNCDQPKCHSASPPAATALQYTTERRFWWILTGQRSSRTL